jgi:DNA-binding CsgD family transcriptional regulator
VAKRNAVDERPWELLTEREHRVVATLAQGQTLKAAAFDLGVSPATIAADIARARRKLGLASRLELVVEARARGDAADDR